MSGGPLPGHAPTHGLAKEIWNMTEEEKAEAFGDLVEEGETEEDDKEAGE